MKPTSRSSTFPRVDAGHNALLGDGFVPEAALEDWIRTGIATRAGAVLTLSDGRRFAMTDGLRILGRRNGESDPYGLTGRLMGLRSLLRRGAVLSSDGVRLGAIIYDAQFGLLSEFIAEEGVEPAHGDPQPPSRQMSSAPPSPR